MSELPELQNGWEWRERNRSESYYYIFFGTEYKQGGRYAGEYGLGGMHGCVFWNEGGDHYVKISHVKSINRHGDPIYSYADVTESFETEEEALNAVPELIEEL